MVLVLPQGFVDIVHGFPVKVWKIQPLRWVSATVSCHFRGRYSFMTLTNTNVYGNNGCMMAVSWSFSNRKPSWPNFDVIS